jgi:hypothetical protein
MFVRGPGIKGNLVDEITVSSHVDLPATWVTLAGADYSVLPTDGQPMPMYRWAQKGKESWFDAFKAYRQYESVPVEYCECTTSYCTPVLAAAAALVSGRASAP